MLEELKDNMPKELYNELLIHLEKDTQPTWTRGITMTGELEPFDCINNDTVLAYIGTFFKSTIQCHFLPLKQKQAAIREFKFKDDVQFIAIGSKTNHIALASKNKLFLWNVESQEAKSIPIRKTTSHQAPHILIFNENEECTRLTFSPHGTSLFIATNQGRCIILNDITRELNYSNPEYRHYFSAPITTLTNSHDGSYLLATNNQGDMIVSKQKDNYNKMAHVPIELPKDSAVVDTIISPDNSMIACNVERNECYFYNTDLEKTVCCPGCFFDIDHDNLALMQMINETNNLLNFFEIDFSDENQNHKCKKIFILPQNTLLCPNNQQINKSLVHWLLDPDGAQSGREHL